MNIIYCLINYGTHFEAKSWDFLKASYEQRLSIFFPLQNLQCALKWMNEKIYCTCESVPSFV